MRFLPSCGVAGAFGSNGTHTEITQVHASQPSQMLVQNACDVPLGLGGHLFGNSLQMSKQQAKVFVGGLSWETSDERLRWASPKRPRRS